MALSANTAIQFLEPPSQRPVVSRAVAGSQHIYKGALVGRLPSGYLKPFVPGDVFDGIADEEFNQTSTTDGAVSDLGDDSERNKPKCRVVTGGHAVLPLSSVVIADIGKPVFATADNTLALIGHPDAFVGYVDDVFATDKAMVRMRYRGERCPIGNGVFNIESDFDFNFPDNITATIAAIEHAGFVFHCVGAGLATSSIGPIPNAPGGEVRMLLDNDSEAENITIQTANILDVLKGMTFTARLRSNVLGPTATTDIDFGLFTADAGAITAAMRANLDVTTALMALIKFHIDGNSVNILAGSDDDTTVVAATDTTKDNSLTVNKKFHIVVRPTGICELWIDNVRVLSGTVFTVGTTIATLYCGIINIEKSTGADVSSLAVDYLRVAGASTPA